MSTSSFNPLSSMQIKQSISSSTTSAIPVNTNTTRNIPIGQSTYDILTIPDKCLRCKSAKPVIFCKECYPFIYFCESCDTHVHSLVSKSNHIRQHISSLNINPNINNNGSELMNSIETVNNANDKISQSGTLLSANYINDIKSLYQKEKDELMQKSFSLERQLEGTKATLNERIKSLLLQVEELQMSKEQEINSIREEYEFQIKKLLEDKDSKIALLIKKNKELTEWNESLVNKVNTYLNVINSHKEESNSNEREYKTKLELVTKEKNDLIKYYETKLSYFNSTYTEDKSGIINSYEEKFEQLKNDYMENKLKMQKLIEQRENDIKEMLDEHKEEILKAREEADLINKSKIEREREYQDMIMKLHEQKYENEVLRGELDKMKKKLTEEVNERNQLEKEYSEMNKSNEYLKVNIEKLHRITHGKFKNIAPSANI